MKLEQRIGTVATAIPPKINPRLALNEIVLIAASIFVLFDNMISLRSHDDF